jgi:hypothetical protein
MDLTTTETTASADSLAEVSTDVTMASSSTPAKEAGVAATQEKSATTTPVKGIVAEEDKTSATTKEADSGLTTNPAEASQYTPSYKYKILDKEYEFDAWMKPLLKDKDTEEKLRDLVTRSHGIDEIKKARDEFRTKLEDIEPKYKNIDASLTYLSDLVNKGDIRSFVEAIRLPKNKLLQYAIEELKYLQLPAEERSRIDAERAEAERVVSLETQNQTLQQQLYQASVQSREHELAMVTSRPDVQTVVNQFNALVGKPDAFRAKVVEKGLTHFHLTGQDLTAEQAVQAVLSEVRPLLGVAVSNPQLTAGQQLAGTGATSAGQPVVVRETKPTIPNIQSGGVSPVKKQPRSLDDLRKLRSQLNAQQ